LAFYVDWVGVFHYWYLSLTSDIWLLLLVANTLVLAVFRHFQTGRFNPWCWGLLGGVAAACSPALALCWGCVVTLHFLRRPAERKKWLTAGVIAVACAVPWAARN